MFGVANQLLATTALMIGTSIILKHNKKRIYALITFIPMLFMLATTLTAGIENIFINYLPQNSFNGNLNAFFSAVMIVLVIVIVVDASFQLLAHLKQQPLRTNEKDEAMEIDI